MNDIPNMNPVINKSSFLSFYLALISPLFPFVFLPAQSDLAIICDFHCLYYNQLTFSFCV